MAAGPSPPDPVSGATKLTGPKPPATSQLARFGPQILLGGLALGAAFAYFASRVPVSQGSPQRINPFRTPNVRNVEKAYTNGGATTMHQPAYGSSTQGSTGADRLRPGGVTGLKDGMNPENMGKKRRPVQPGIRRRNASQDELRKQEWEVTFMWGKLKLTLKIRKILAESWQRQEAVFNTAFLQITS